MPSDEQRDVLQKRIRGPRSQQKGCPGSKCLEPSAQVGAHPAATAVSSQLATAGVPPPLGLWVPHCLALQSLPQAPYQPHGAPLNRKANDKSWLCILLTSCVASPCLSFLICEMGQQYLTQALLTHRSTAWTPVRAQRGSLWASSSPMCRPMYVQQLQDKHTRGFP